MAQYPKGIAQRQRILRAALQAYAEQTSDAPTLGAIARRVGISEAGVLHHFGSKDALFVAILVERDADALERFGAFADEESVWAYLHETTQTPGLTKLFVDMSVAASDPEHPAAAFLERHTKRLHGLVARLLGGTEGNEGLADQVIAAAEGLQLRWLREPRIDVVVQLRSLVDHLRNHH